jgi:hypothetical protein
MAITVGSSRVDETILLKTPELEIRFVTCGYWNLDKLSTLNFQVAAFYY